jgi:hypothetical protein
MMILEDNHCKNIHIMKYHFLILVGTLFSTFACKKDNDGGEFGKYFPKDCYENTDFDCKGIRAEQYFTGKLNGKDFCLSADTIEYECYYKPVLTIVTSGPVLDLATAKGAFGLEVGIRPKVMADAMPEFSLTYIHPDQTTYQQSLSVAIQQVFDQAFKVGPLKLRGTNNPQDSTDVFTAQLFLRCDNLHTYGGFETVWGNQQDAKLNCTQYKREETKTEIIYHITLEVECNLYIGNLVVSNFWRKLTNGRMVLRYVLKK